MNKRILLVIPVALAFLFLFFEPKSQVQEVRSNLSPENKFEARFLNARKRWEYEQMLLRNPVTGVIPRGIFRQERDFAARAPVRKRRGKTNAFVPRGPGNMGGRTRAIAFDHADTTSGTLLAGGVTSGVFRTTDRGLSWTKVSPSDAIHSVTSIVQDPTNTDVWYYGTGEILGFNGRWGDGIWKSTNGGLEWAQLAATASANPEFIDNSFDLIHRLAVDPATGNVYAAVHRNIFRSADGGASWDPVLTTQTPISVLSGQTDIVINSSGTRFYAAFHGKTFDNMAGLWTSTTGNNGSWSKIAGVGSFDTPLGWARPDDYGRIVMALAPSEENLLYILYDNDHKNDCEEGSEEKPEADLFLFDSDSGDWTDLSQNLPDVPGRCTPGNDPFAIQGGYDLVIAVSPTDANLVFIGGTNLYRSSNGFANGLGTQRIGGYRNSNSYQLYANHHPDIHMLVFDPLDADKLVCGSDGGIHEAFARDTPAFWTSLNNDYITFQYYKVALSPQAGDTRVLGGAQDNGTTLGRSGKSQEMIFGGDGVSVGIGDDLISGTTVTEVYYLGAQLGQFFRLKNNYEGIKPEGSGEGLFITLFLLDPDNTEFLYYVDDNHLYRTDNASTVGSGGWTEMTGVAEAVGRLDEETPFKVSSLAVTRGPYSSGSKLYFGDNFGRVFRLDDPQGASPATIPTNITPPGVELTPGTVVSALAVDPTDDSVLMAVYSNFGVPGIFVTLDGGTTWSGVQGNLELPAKRAAAIANVNGKPVFFVGTTVGLWRTDQLDGTATVWERDGADSIQYALVSSLALRPEDNTLLAGTYGNGMFTTVLGVSDAADQNLFLPDIRSDDAGADTLVGILNPSDELVSFDIFAFTGTGELLGRSTLVDELAPHALARFSVKDAFPDVFDNIDWIQVGSKGELTVYAELMDGETHSAYGASQLAERVLMPHIAKNTASFETVLSAVNGSSQTVACTLTEHPDNQVFSLDDAAGPFSRSSKPITEFLGDDLRGGPDLWAQLDCSERAIAAMEFFTRIPARTQQAALGLGNQRGRTLNFLHVATDTNRFWTGMVYINSDQVTVTATETYYDVDGNLLATHEETLSPDEKITLLFDFQNQERVPTGTAWTRVIADGDLIGYELFGSPGISSDDTFTGLQGNYGGAQILDYPHFISNEAEFTGVVALNLGDVPADISFTAYAADGTQLETVTIENVPARTKLARVLTSLFSDERTFRDGAWIRASTTGSEWAGFLLWGDKGSNRRFLSGLNAVAR